MFEKYEELKSLINELEDDMLKSARGVKVASVRARKKLMIIKDKAADLRKDLLNEKKQKTGS